MNKKGFTLVELLAVIVILAVVMLIAVTAVGPMMERSRKNALGTEGIALLKAAKAAYQAEGMKGQAAKYRSNSTVCFSMEYLCRNGYYEKGCAGEENVLPKDGGDGYTGSVLVSYADDKYTYTFWISNGTYVFGTVGGTSGDGTNDKGFGNIDDPNVVSDGEIASTTCGMLSYDNLHNQGYIYCRVSGGNIICS